VHNPIWLSKFLVGFVFSSKSDISLISLLCVFPPRVQFPYPLENPPNPVRPTPLRVLHLHLQFSVVDYAIVHLSPPPKKGGKSLIVTISTLVKLRLSHVSDTDSFSQVYAFHFPCPSLFCMQVGSFIYTYFFHKFFSF